MSDNLKVIPVANVFENAHYSVPIYQRNYAWNELQILQLIEDIDSTFLDGDVDRTYFLGNLIVNQTANNVYEVIDGQQRLTTLYLIELYLKFSFSKDALRFEARDTSNRTLAHLSDDKADTLPEELASAEILNGYHIIQNYFETNPINKEEFSKKLESVFLIRVQVPKNIDLNHYFEIMNTRGEQLELHEIAKAKLLKVLKTEQDKHIGAMIWDKCSNMNSYVQMNFEPSHRKILFTHDWSSLHPRIKNFDTIVDQVMKIDNNKGYSQSKDSLLNILKSNKISDAKNKELEDENERFESTISFPNFLLQVNAVLQDSKSNASLDDKDFLNSLSWSWKNHDQAKKFLFSLLKCRVLYDKYIVKREFAHGYKETGKWSLQRLKKYHDTKRNSYKPTYVGTIKGKSGDEQNKKLRTLQSCLRITYTSPKTMHWISLVLSHLLNDDSTDLIKLLEQYCCEKVSESNYETKSGFEIERIVFSYLDYLIFRDGYSYKNKSLVSDDWQFQFRNSIEHFYPQHPIDGTKWDDSDLHSLGNLALITVSGNSKFSNLSPLSKIDSYPNLIKQSLKLTIMQAMTTYDDEKWTKEKAHEHQMEMEAILKKDITKNIIARSQNLQATP